MDQLAGLVRIQALYGAAERDTTVTASDGVDIKDLADNLVVALDSAAGTGTNPALALAIQHRADASDVWAAVPAAALYDPATGDAAVFAPVTTAASFQALALRRERLKAEVRAVLTITGDVTPAFVCAVHLVGMPRYAAGW